MENKAKNNWIREDVILDFHIPKDIKQVINSLEELAEDNDYGYVNYYDYLDNICKEAYRQRHLTQKQWDKILYKFGGILDD